MKIRLFPFLFSILFSLNSYAQKEGCLYQYSTITALAKSYYDGEMPFSDLLKHGDFGIGTFNHLDGEMVCVDSQIFQICADGKVNTVADSSRTPFSLITHFKAQKKYKLNQPADIHQLENILDSLLGTKNLIASIKITGKFKSLKTRSVKSQNKPYPLLMDVVKDQQIFDLYESVGTLVGFRFPDYMDGVNVPGYHLHFLSTDHKTGGHLINCITDDINIEIELIPNFQMRFPTDKTFLNMNLKKVSSHDINKIEKQQ